jgi:hypothetical protein
MAPQALGRLDAATSDSRSNAARSQPCSQVLVVVAFVAVKLGWAAPTRSTAGADRRDAEHQWLKGLAVVAVADQVDLRSLSIAHRDQSSVP